MVEPDNDGKVWWREDRVSAALEAAMAAAVEAHGNVAKGVCWDVRSEFHRRIRSYELHDAMHDRIGSR